MSESNRGVHFSKVDDKDIDFEAEEKKAQRRWNLVKEEKEKKEKWKQEESAFFDQLADPQSAPIILQWYDFYPFRLNLDCFFVQVGVPNAASNNLQANLAELPNIDRNTLSGTAREFLHILVVVLKNHSSWTTGKIVTPTNSPNNRPGPGNNGGGAGGIGGARVVLP